MNGHLPPLSALRAFEATARLRSFGKAAGELNVTPAAISHQIHALEEDLGIRLFHRLNRSIERSEEHTSELQSQSNLVCRLLLEKKKKIQTMINSCAKSATSLVTTLS